MNSVLDAVTVYASGAICTRRSQVQPSQVVERRLRLSGLPLSLQSGSLRARVLSGPERLRVLDVRADFDVKQAAEVDVPLEQQALEKAQQQLARLRQALARLEEQIGEISQLRPSFPMQKKGTPPREAPIDAMLKLGAFVEAETLERQRRRRELTEQLKDAANEVELRQRRLAEASTALKTERVQLSRAAVVTLSEMPPSPFELALEYQVPGARWAPSYELRLGKDLAGGTLAMRASIIQQTGEDWSQVKLSLSTAALDRRTDLPELKALKIGRSQPLPPRSGWREPPAGLDELFSGFDEANALRPMPPPPAQPMPVTRNAPAPKKAAKTVHAASVEKAASVAMPQGMAMDLSRQRAGAPGAMPPPAPPVMAAPMAKRSSGLVSALGGAVAAGFKGMAAKDSLEDGAMPEEMAAMEPQMEGGGYDDEVTGSFGRAEAEPLQAAPDRAMLDYDRMAMPPPESGGARGRLRSMNDLELFMVSHVSVQVDVLTAVMVRSDQRARSPLSIGFPTQCHDVRDSAGSYDYRYDCAARVDVPSTGKWSLVPVMATSAGFAPGYTTVPSVEPKVYRVLAIANKGPHALLRGPVDVSVGDEFLLTAQLPNIAPGAEDARLGLGVEEAIKVARKTQFKETTGGLLGGSTVLPHEIEIELNNRLAFPALIEVRERVPFSPDDAIKIEESAKPGWEKDEKVRDGVQVDGGRRWKISVPAGQKTTLTAQFSIRIPADKMLVGGNRRV